MKRTKAEIDLLISDLAEAHYVLTQYKRNHNNDLVEAIIKQIDSLNEEKKTATNPNKFRVVRRENKLKVSEVPWSAMGWKTPREAIDKYIEGLKHENEQAIRSMNNQLQAMEDNKELKERNIELIKEAEKLEIK